MKRLKIFCFLPAVVALVALAGCSKQKYPVVNVGIPEQEPTPLDTVQQTHLDTVKQNIQAVCAGIQNEVATFRGKAFLRAVATKVYTRDEYIAQVLSVPDPTDPSPALKAIYNRTLTAEGFLRPGDDLFAESDEMMAQGVSGFFKEGTNTINIIIPDTANTMDRTDSTTVFHELVHALQDQYYNLKTLRSTRNTSDSYFALKYAIEGEARLLEEYYYYKLVTGAYPVSTGPIDNAFTSYHNQVELWLDTQGQQGERFYIYQPMYWLYYSFGPQLVSTIAGMDWTKIDNPLFANLPVKTRETLHPDIYQANQRQQYAVSLSALVNAAHFDSLFDNDEWGEALWATLFREWGNTGYKRIAEGVISDRIVVGNKRTALNYALYGYTLWKDQAEAHEFLLNYSTLLQAKYGNGLVLPVPAGAGSAYIVDYTGSPGNIYLEQSDNRVYIMEKYPSAEKSTLLSALRNAPVTDWTPGTAKVAGQNGQFGRIPRTPREGTWY
jgi:hypothetical protein